MMTDKKTPTETEPTAKVAAGLPIETNLTPAVQNDLGQASLELYCPVQDANGQTIGIAKTLLIQRATTSIEALENLLGQLTQADKLGFTLISPANPRPQASVQAPSMPGTSPSLPPGLAPAGSPPPVPGSNGNGSEAESGTWEVALVKVTPLPDNYVKVEFFRSGQNQPCLKFTKAKMEKTIQMFRDGTGLDFTADHFRVANQFNMNLKIDWKLGRPTGFGNTRYRDIIAIHSA